MVWMFTKFNLKVEGLLLREIRTNEELQQLIDQTI